MSWTPVVIRRAVEHTKPKDPRWVVPHARPLADCIGQPIRIWLPPEEVTRERSCEVEIVWRVHPEDVERITGHRHERAFVCIHEFEGD